MKPKFSPMLLVLAVLLTTKASHAQNTNMQKNKETVVKLYEQALNRKNLDLLPEIISADYTGAQGEKGPEGFQKGLLPLLKAFPDIRYEIENLIAEGDTVVIHWKLTGTQTGQFRDIPPTGKTIANNGMAIFQLRDHKIIKAMILTDRLAFLQDLGVIPANLSQPAAQPSKTSINFIDKFFVPAGAKSEFLERMRMNRSFLRTLPGFIRDKVYQHTDENGNLICITVALWESQEAVDKAKEAVQAEYRKEGFDMQAMLKRLNITIDRGVYTEMTD